MPHQFTTSYIEDCISLLVYSKSTAERAMAQIADEHLFATLDPESNSIGVIVKHMSGNMRSRWTDFLTRDRDSEFEDPPATRAAVLDSWEAGWSCVFSALHALTDDDLPRTVLIRGEPHSVMQAINRQLAHYSLHIGQIILLAKHYAGEKWQSLTIPRRASADFNQRVLSGKASQR